MYRIYVKHPFIKSWSRSFISSDSIRFVFHFGYIISRRVCLRACMYVARVCVCLYMFFIFSTHTFCSYDCDFFSSYFYRFRIFWWVLFSMWTESGARERERLTPNKKMQNEEEAAKKMSGVWKHIQQLLYNKWETRYVRPKTY